jgi:hypothetical protein
MFAYMSDIIVGPVIKSTNGCRLLTALEPPDLALLTPANRGMQHAASV